jgi:predicted cation transporter
LNPTTIEILATTLFAIAIAHTFLCNKIEHLAHKYPEGSIGENGFHLLGEVEVVFGLWASVFLLGITALAGGDTAIHYVESKLTLAEIGSTAPHAAQSIQVNFTEPMFVFVIMAMAATRPILQISALAIEAVSKTLPIPQGLRFYAACLVMGPLLGSFITEPAAMTVTALLLKRRFYDKGISKKLMYATMGVLFVNVSIGGTLTNFAAPPVLMVAEKWNYTIGYMMTHFGWKAALAVIVNAVVVTWMFRRELRAMVDVAEDMPHTQKAVRRKVPVWLIVVQLLLMGLVVMTAHHMAVFFIIFLLFLGITIVTAEHQDELKLKESLLVGYFLMGLVILGGFQRWWLEPILSSMGDLPLFLGTTGLTGITDNAALTYLGSQVPNLAASSKFALVAGAVAGGGLTVIANAPNPAGYGILKPSFGEGGISPLKLLQSALFPTLIAMLALWLLPNLGGELEDPKPPQGVNVHEVQPAAHGGH